MVLFILLLILLDDPWRELLTLLILHISIFPVMEIMNSILFPLLWKLTFVIFVLMFLLSFGILLLEKLYIYLFFLKIHVTYTYLWYLNKERTRQESYSLWLD